MRVDGEGRGHGTWTAVITAGDGVGIDLEELNESIVDAILVTGVMPGRQRRIGLERAIRAAGVNRAHRACHDPPVALHAAAYRNHGRMCGIARRQFFSVRHNYFYWPFRALREEVGHGEIDPVALAA